MTEESKGPKSLPFDGTDKSYPIWKKKFLSLCHYKKCGHMLTTDHTMPPADQVLDPDDDYDNTIIVLRDANTLAFSMLTLSCQTETTMSILDASVTEAFPDGCARTAWKSLDDHHDPKSTSNKYELRQKFTQCVLKNDQTNPDDWFAELETIRARLKNHFQYTISDEDMISHIVYNTKPKMYQTLLTMVKRELNNSVAVTIESLKKDIKQIYAQRSENENRKDKEMVLSAVSAGRGKRPPFKKPFKGDCRICGVKGHKAADCWENPKNNDKRPPNYKPKNVSVPSPTDPSKEKRKCTFCGKDNHTVDNCFKKKKQDKKSSSDNVAQLVMVAIDGHAGNDFHSEMMLLHKEGTDIGHIRRKYNISKDTFIMDSGATSHMRFSLDGMKNLKPWKVPVKVGNAQDMYSEQIGSYHGKVIQKNGSTFDIVLDDVLYIPDLYINLFSLTKVLHNKQVDLRKEKNTIALTYFKHKILFDRVVTVGKGSLLGVDIVPNAINFNTALMSYTEYHDRLGHPHEWTVRQTAKHYKIPLSGVASPCENCAKGKMKKANIAKETITNLAQAPGDRISFDISSVQATSQGGNKFWLLIMDEYTKYCWSYFMKHKSDLPNVMMRWLHQFQRAFGRFVKFFRCDNAGENMKFKQMVDEHYSYIKFEFTAPNTPQQNGRIERKFATLYGKVRSMLNKARLTRHLRDNLWAQAALVATQLENILVDESGKTPHVNLKGENPPWINHLRTFGEIAIAYNNAPIKSKLKDRGFPAMFIGYSEHHAAGVFRLYNLQNRQWFHSRNVVWLNKVYGEYYNIQATHTTVLPEVETYDIADAFQPLPEITPARIPNMRPLLRANDDLDVLMDNNDDTVTTAESTAPVTPRVSGLNREVRNLTTFFNPEPLVHMTPPVDPAPAMAPVLAEDVALSATDPPLPPTNLFPSTYRDAMTRRDKIEWWKAMLAEFESCETKGVWKIIKKSNLPKGRKIIGNRWVYVQKDDGRYRARTVAKGFSQIPGKDFQENHAPVVHDTTFHLILVIKIMCKLSSRHFDIETAFLYGTLDEEIYMIFPDGYEKYLHDKGMNYSEQDYCLLLTRALYGLVQAARQWWKKITEVFAKLDFHPTQADPCLFVKKVKPNEPPAFIILYVDDGGIIGTPQVIQDVLNALAKEFKIKDLGEMIHFVGCHLRESSDKKTIWIHQPKLIKHLKKEFKDLIITERVFRTPAAPKTVIMRPDENDPVISSADQTKYRSGVGMLLYLVKHSRPDLSNSVRELTKVLDRATQAHWKAMMRVIKYVLDTRSCALKLQPKIMEGSNEKYYLEGISDSEFAGDRETRVSVYGYATYFCGALISWKSKSSKSVTLSSTEAEYFASSEAAKELMFIHNLLVGMSIIKDVKLPLVLRVDNTGAIYLANNHTTSPRTKHIDIRAHYVRQLIDCGILKIVFVKSEDNDADIYTKNVSEELFNKHVDKNVTCLSEVNEQGYFVIVEDPDDKDFILMIK